MAGDTDNPRIWLGGEVWVADIGATEPTDVSDDLESLGWEPLGLLHPDGDSESREADTADHFAWGGALFRHTVTNEKRTKMVKALEENPVVFDLINPGSTTSTVGDLTTRTYARWEPNPKAFVFKTVDGGYTSLQVFPKGEVAIPSEIVRNSSTPTAFDIAAVLYLADDDHAVCPGEFGYELTDNPAAASAS